VSGGLGDRLQVTAAEAAQVLGVDGLRLLRQVAEAPVRRVGPQQRVVRRAAAGAVVPVAERLLVAQAGLDRGDEAVEDGATVKVFYEARLAKVELPEEARQALDTGFEDVTELAETDTREKLKTRWARVEAVVGASKRVKEVAADIVAHWEARRGVLAGKVRSGDGSWSGVRTMSPGDTAPVRSL